MPGTYVGGPGPDFSVSNVYDVYFLNEGNDFASGSEAPQTFYGGAGNDGIVGGYSVSKGDGSAGNPSGYSSVGVSGNDYIDGGADTDWLYGGDGDDVVLGGAVTTVCSMSGTTLMAGCTETAAMTPYTAATAMIWSMAVKVQMRFPAAAATIS